jgi:hypothetical protein
MIASEPEMWLRALGTALAGLSVAFAGYMLAYGEGKVRVNGMEHLAIFAQPRGSAGASDDFHPSSPFAAAGGPSADEGSKGSPPAQRAAIVAARPDRVWLMVGGVIRSVGPRDDVPGIGRINAIVRRDDGWALVDDKGATLLAGSKGANGAALLSHRMIFD